MRYLKITVMMVDALALALLLGLAGCGEHHGDRDWNGSPGHYEGSGNERRDSDRRDARGGDAGRDRSERGGR